MIINVGTKQGVWVSWLVLKSEYVRTTMKDWLVVWNMFYFPIYWE